MIFDNCVGIVVMVFVFSADRHHTRKGAPILIFRPCRTYPTFVRPPLDALLGAIPDEVGGLTALTTLNLTYNSITGEYNAWQPPCSLTRLFVSGFRLRVWKGPFPDPHPDHS